MTDRIGTGRIPDTLEAQFNLTSGLVHGWLATKQEHHGRNVWWEMLLSSW